jgi:parvulin-like peptidyl-prolyl isomerase
MGVYREVKLAIVIAVFLCFLPYITYGEIVDRIVAVVGDKPITLTALRKALKLKKNSELRKVPVLEQQKTLDMLIEQELIEQRAKKIGISVSDTEVDEEIENVKKANNITTELLELALQNEGMTLSDYRDAVRFQILKAKVINREVRPFVVITDELLLKYYNEEIAKNLEKVVSFRVITIYDDSNGKLAKDIKEYYSMAQKNVNFDEIVKKASENYKVTDYAPKNIKLKTLSHELIDAIKDMKPGELGPLVRFSNGFQIFRLDAVNYEGLKPYDEVKEELKKQYQKDKLEQVYIKWIEDLKKEIYVEKRL